MATQVPTVIRTTDTYDDFARTNIAARLTSAITWLDTNINNNSWNLNYVTTFPQRFSCRIICQNYYQTHTQVYDTIYIDDTTTLQDVIRQCHRIQTNYDLLTVEERSREPLLPSHPSIVTRPITQNKSLEDSLSSPIYTGLAKQGVTKWLRQGAQLPHWNINIDDSVSNCKRCLFHVRHRSPYARNKAHKLTLSRNTRWKDIFNFQHRVYLLEGYLRHESIGTSGQNSSNLPKHITMTDNARR